MCLRPQSAGSTIPRLRPTGSSLGIAPVDYDPVVLLKPFGPRLAAGALPSRASSMVAPGRPIRVPAFAVVPHEPLHTFHPLWPVRRYPHLRISVRGPGPSGTSTHLTRQLPGTHSSLARLFIALPFAATVLRLVRGKSFGVVVVGDSSIGKTLLLRLAASVPGHNGEDGLTTLKASSTAIEELVLGHRDGFLPLDEIGQIEGDPKAVAEFLKALSFMISTGQRRNRASPYEDAIGAIKPDTRVIVGMTTETSLAALARHAQQQRLRGEE